MRAILGTIFGGLAQAGLGVLNNELAGEKQKEFMGLNYEYNEQAARNADARTRALYNDFYSPEALLRQYKAAGLSPSMMFGGTPGQGGMSGAMGGGAAGNSAPYMPISMIEGAQLGMIRAQEEKLKAETKNIETDTKNKQQELSAITIQNEMARMDRMYKAIQFNIVTSSYQEGDRRISLYDVAKEKENFEQFEKWVINYWEKIDPDNIHDYKTEQGQKTLRAIFTNSKTFEKDLQVISEIKTSSKFNQSIIDALNNTEFANMNAESAVKYLKANIQTAELQEREKAAWNNLLDRLGGSGDKWHDIIVVLGMILNNAACNWKMPSINNNSYTTNNNTYEL